MLVTLTRQLARRPCDGPYSGQQALAVDWWIDGHPRALIEAVLQPRLTLAATQLPHIATSSAGARNRAVRVVTMRASLGSDASVRLLATLFFIALGTLGCNSRYLRGKSVEVRGTWPFQTNGLHGWRSWPAKALLWHVPHVSPVVHSGMPLTASTSGRRRLRHVLYTSYTNLGPAILTCVLAGGPL
jgi:hypothetical protein